MNIELIREIEDKENKSQIDWELLRYYKSLAIISNILVSESKMHVSSEDAIRQIRNVMQDNL